MSTFSCRDQIIMHPSFSKAMMRVEALHRKALETAHAGGLLITGPSGAGKSTLKDTYLSRHPRVEELERTRIPILTVDTPAMPSVKNLVEALAIALAGEVFSGSAASQTLRIYTLLRECGVELIIFDEFQHFIDQKMVNETRKVTDWLKNLLNTVSIPVVLLGLPQSGQVLEINEQLRRRFSSKCYLSPFLFEAEQTQKEFRGVLHAIQERMPVTCKIPLYEGNLARRFHFASNGLFDYIAKMVDGAVDLAEELGVKEIDDELLAVVFEQEIWSDAPKILNPFRPEFVFRRLDRTGEPFCLPDRLARTKQKVAA